MIRALLRAPVDQARMAEAGLLIHGLVAAEPVIIQVQQEVHTVVVVQEDQCGTVPEVLAVVAVVGVVAEQPLNI
jgi:hypothetical protein